jgi:GH24 family phage-related lysozyme (muramidase)
MAFFTDVMPQMTIYARDSKKCYRIRMTQRQVRYWDNGAMISCGLTVGKGRFKASSLKRLIKAGRATEIDYDTWNHSGCQSSCVMRGGTKCQW